MPETGPFRPLRDRPHWSARLENGKNRLVGTALRTAGWDVRLQPFHGYGSDGTVRILARALYARPGTPADFHDQPVVDMRSMAVRGWRNFTSQVAPFRKVRILVDGQEFSVRADRAGIVDALIHVDLPPGTHEVVLSTHPGNEVTASVWIVDPAETHGLVSDIDDTVMVTWLPRPMLAFWNAFVVHQSSRKVVPGMPMLYQRFRREYPDAPVIYLSTGAWNVFPVLQRFLFKNGYPEGPMLLTDWGPTNTGMFRSGMQHKDRSLEQLAEMMPGVRWLLIGDDGQHDPEIYGRFSQNHPDHVRAVAIRQLTPSEQVLAHGTTRPMEEPTDRGPVPTVEAPDGNGLLRELQRIDVLS
ncbi:DUF2183 domain-containing protein [Brachybacterium sp. EF45031]|uniref:App1 family protein n=1 Tax=Brachybacterium sillae TaxID=2810536 RepID=UPI00217D476A|nr:phosphatase domain-containing protein [Brachybacterium sillae]MCS6711464.1 DUF2183 domain-containing protein [Brachybacterium sillae]